MNIYDIAKEAGVSIATVSRVLNNKGTVSAATRARVEAILKQNNYTPSAIARGMVSKSMRTVAVLTVDIRVPHYARTAYTIEREFSRRGYEVILCNTGGDRAETLRYLQAVNQKQVDGIVLVGSVFDTICQGAEMEKLLSGVPVVLANGKLDLPNAYSVTVDDKYGVSLAVEHLVARGRKSIYYMLRAGLRVPEQVAVVGFNNSDYAHLCEPVLTSVDNKPEQVALLCVQLLESSIERSEAYSSVVLQPELAQGEAS